VRLECQGPIDFLSDRLFVEFQKRHFDGVLSSGQQRELVGMFGLSTMLSYETPDFGYFPPGRKKAAPASNRYTSGRIHGLDTAWGLQEQSNYLLPAQG
jgi:hypothetical protein